MTLSDDAVAWALELFENLGPITTRRMMGGLCLYLDGQIFAILDSDGTLFLKAQAAFADTLKQAGARQFGAGTGRTMGYWTMPEDGLDDADTACDWARRALENL